MQNKENRVANALSRGFVLVNILASRMMGFENLKKFYAMGSYFKEAFNDLTGEAG